MMRVTTEQRNRILGAIKAAEGLGTGSCTVCAGGLIAKEFGFECYAIYNNLCQRMIEKHKALVKASGLNTEDFRTLQVLNDSVLNDEDPLTRKRKVLEFLRVALVAY